MHTPNVLLSDIDLLHSDWLNLSGPFIIAVVQNFKFSVDSESGEVNKRSIAFTDKYFITFWQLLTSTKAFLDWFLWYLSSSNE